MSRSDPLFCNLKANLLAAVKTYHDENMGGENGKLRAYNFKRAVEAVSDTDAQKEIKDHNPLIELMITVISYTHSTKLKALIFNYNGLFNTEETFLKFLQQNQNRENPRPDYFYYEKAAELMLPKLPDNYAPTITDWNQFQNDLNSVIKEYLNKGDGGIEGKFRAERLLEALEKITDPRKLTLLACAVVFEKSSSKTLKAAILTKINHTEAQLRNLQFYQRISSIEITRIEYAINSSASIHLDQGAILKEKIMGAVDRYLARNNPDRKNNTASVVIKANQIKAALKSCQDDTRELMRLVYLITLNTSFFTSDELKNEILAAIGLRESDFKQLVSDFEQLLYAYNYEEHFGDFKKIAKKDAEQAFENDGFPEISDDTAYTLNVDCVLISQSISTLETAIGDYKKKHRDALGFARADNLLSELLKIKRKLPENSLPTPDEIMQFRKDIFTLVCAIVFKSGSTELKKEILTKLKLDEKTLKTIQLDLNISNYTAWKTAREINTLTRVTDWDAFKNAMLFSAKAYRNANFGRIDGKRRAQNVITVLENELTNMTPHQYQYRLILIVNAIVFKSGSTILRLAMLDYLSTINIDETGLKNLAAQYGVSENTIERARNKLASSSAVTPTANSSIETDWEKYVKPGLDLAISRYQTTKQGGSRGKLRAENIRRLLQTISNPPTAENKNHLALIMCALVLLDKSTILKQKIMLCTGMNTDQIKTLQKQENISDAAYVEFEKRLTDERKEFVTAGECSAILTENPSVISTSRNLASLFVHPARSVEACPIQDWRKLKLQITGFTNQYTQNTQSSIIRKTKARNLGCLVRGIADDLGNPAEQEKLAMLSCTIILHAKIAELGTQSDQETFKNLQRWYGFSDNDCKRQAKQLMLEETEFPTIILPARCEHKHNPDERDDQEMTSAVAVAQ